MQTITRYFQVAEHCFSISATPEQFSLLPNYEPFLVDESAQTCMFITRVHTDERPSLENWQHVFTDSSDADMPRIEMYKKGEEWFFLLSMYRDSEIVCALRCSADWHETDVYIFSDCARFAIDNAVMLVYAFCTTAHDTLLFHASVIKRQDKAFLFLGHSGTGKSTHSQQWLAAFEDAELINDDNPVVRIMPDGIVRVFGSPWSGKTPCYRAMQAPVGAFVQIIQAPFNCIQPLKMTQAYPHIHSSVSGLKMLPAMMDKIYESIVKILEKCAVYQLECLPNTDAARVCAQRCLP